MLELGLSRISKNPSVAVRIIAFCDWESQKEYRLVTNLPFEGEKTIKNEEIGEIYRQRWQIKLLWKFLKMHLKLDQIITRIVNSVTL